MQTAAEYTSFFGGCFALVLFAGLLSQRRLDFRQVLQAVVCLVLGTVLISLYFSYARLDTPMALNYLFFPVLWLIGPVFYLYFFSSVEQDFMQGRRWKLHLFWPGLISFAVLPFVDRIAALPRYPLDFFSMQAMHPAAHVVTAVFTLNLGYFLLIYLRGRLVIRYSFLGRDVASLYFTSVLVACYVINVLALLAMALQSIDLIIVSTISITVLLVVSFVVMQRYPHVFHELEVAIDNARAEKNYSKSQLSGVSLKKLEADLEGLMNRQVYHDEQLSLSSLARMVSVSSHQLSEYLNRHRSKNFSQYINEYRIDEARQILKDDPDASVLSVAYRVGFNSKSAFNSSFQKIAGTSPTRFRQHGAD